MTPTWPVLALAAVTGACADPPDGTGVVIEIVADQPHSTELGVSVAVHARGGHSIEIAVERGTLLALGAPRDAGDGLPAGCHAGGASDVPFTVALSVRPSGDEALLFASLFADPSCAGERIQTRIVAVRSRSTNDPPPDAMEPEGQP
jgi:hypothetical protein